MRRYVPMVIVILLVLTGIAAAQEPTATPGFGSVIGSAQATATSAATLQPAIGAAPELTPIAPGSDARSATCIAPQMPGFVPYVIRPGDRLGDLIAGVDNLTVTQLAVLNCLDDPGALPVGATIWIPGTSAAGVAAEPALPREAELLAVAEAEIRSLSASADPAPNLEGVTFTWDATGGQVFFYPCPADETAPCERPLHAASLPGQHALTIQPFHYAGPVRFRLEAVGSAEHTTRDITVNVVCSQAWLGEVTGLPRCADEPPRVVFAVWQPFENGAMLYMSDTSEIYVLTNDRRVQVFPDTFIEGMPDAEYDEVPADRVPARRGFGIVWNQLGGPDSPLGWGLAQEQGYDMQRQAAGRVSYTTYVTTPDGAVYAITASPDTGTGYWTEVGGG